MGALELQTPLWAAVALVVVLPLAALAVATRRVERVRRVLGLAAPPGIPHAVPALALLAIALFVGGAAAQPVLLERDEARVRRDAEVLFLVDVSRSMLAAPRPGRPTRFDRAREATRRLRAAVPQAPAGLASLTDRVLPHLFPTHDRLAFERTLDRAVEGGRPLPQFGGGRATTFEGLPDVASRGYFSDAASRRVLVVVTDGEALPVDHERLREELAEAPPLEAVFVRFGAASDRVFLPDGTPEPYRGDPRAPAELARVAEAVDGTVVEEGEEGAQARAEAALVRALGEGPTDSVRERRRTRALGPFVLACALLPVGLLVVRRNRA